MKFYVTLEVDVECQPQAVLMLAGFAKDVRDNPNGQIRLSGAVLKDENDETVVALDEHAEIKK